MLVYVYDRFLRNYIWRLQPREPGHQQLGSDTSTFQSKCTDEYQVETMESKCAEEQELFPTLSTSHKQHPLPLRGTLQLAQLDLTH